MKISFTLFLLIVSLSSFCQNEDAKQLFKTKIKANVTVNDSINLDEFKSLVIIPGGHLRKDLEKINYFDQIMTEKEFKKELITAGLDPAKYNLESKEGAENIFNNYKKFIFVFQSIKEGDPNIRLIIILTPFGKKVFEVEGKEKTHVIGIAAGTNYLPVDLSNAMFNELVDYIRRNSKTYQ